MRIVAGEFRGRRLVAPQGEGTRPTTDRVREALFSSLTSLAGPSFGDGHALDLFAGSGALGLEALSRGIGHVTFVDSDRSALAAVNTNIAALGVQSRAIVTQGDSTVLSERGAIRGGPFSLLLLDPPYRLDAGAVGRLVSQLIAHDLLEEGAIIVYEHASGVAAHWPAGVSSVARKRYGSTEVDIANLGKGTESA